MRELNKAKLLQRISQFDIHWQMTDDDRVWNKLNKEEKDIKKELENYDRDELRKEMSDIEFNYWFPTHKIKTEDKDECWEKIGHRLAEIKKKYNA